MNSQYLLTQLTAHFFADSLRNGHGCDSTGLCAANHAKRCVALLHHILRELRGFSRAGLSNDHNHLVLSNYLQPRQTVAAYSAPKCSSTLARSSDKVSRRDEHERACVCIKMWEWILDTTVARSPHTDMSSSRMVYIGRYSRCSLIVFVRAKSEDASVFSFM